jgi:PadR family transcriptional regulator, regulatory protein AphA
MMDSPKISLLGYALLGLIQERPVSGYSLRKIFTATPMGSFSDSPGAIYPALGRLEAQGLIEGTVEEGSGLRLRKIYRLQPAGSAALKRWLERPVAREDVVRGMGELMLRFSFMGRAADAELALRFLESVRTQLAGYVPELEQYAAANESKMPLSGMLALDHGVRIYRASLGWTEAALAAYARQKVEQEKGSKT